MDSFVTQKVAECIQVTVIVINISYCLPNQGSPEPGLPSGEVLTPEGDVLSFVCVMHAGQATHDCVSDYLCSSVMKNHRRLKSFHKGSVNRLWAQEGVWRLMEPIMFRRRCKEL